ncbi:MAG: RnfABCDGE type electron transport complex subunit B [Sedimentisphaerales bacterium]|nr:RnfABCDGE type electron transport complex subunit B [Sedimentisphaerales bacterium]
MTNMILANIAELWSVAWPAGLTMLILGLGFAIALLIASIKLKVKTDPRIEAIHDVLPHVNCGACGFSGCMKYAEALLAKPELIGKCAPGGPKTAQAIAKILNIEISNVGPLKKPIVNCRARTEDKIFYATYQGIPSCLSANALANVQACKFGCLGFGDCVRACKFNSLHIIDGLAVVDYSKCTGCGACARACPRNLIEMAPFNNENMMSVACSSRESGKVTRSQCAVGCIACGLCVRQTDLFKVTDNLARIDYERFQPSPQTETAMAKCPTGVIVFRGPTAPVPRLPKPKPVAAAAT